MDGHEEAGPGWLDEADAALESFMQEDALLEAIRSAPEAEGKVQQTYEVDASATESTTGQSTRSQAGGAAGSSDPGSSRASADEGTEASGLLLRREGDGAGPKERRTDPAAEPPRLATAGRQQPLEVAGPENADGKGPKAKPSKSLPWRGAVLTAATVLGMVLWGPSLYEEEPQARPVPASYAEPKPIRMPSVDDAVEGGQAAANASAFGVRRGSIGVRWSSESAVNVSQLAAADGSGSTADAPPRTDHGRRGRSMRGKAGTSELR